VKLIIKNDLNKTSFAGIPSFHCLVVDLKEEKGAAQIVSDYGAHPK
jgi:hypothetical protein